MTFFFWSLNFRKWPLEVMAHEELVQILSLGKLLGSLGNNQSESKVPRLQGDLQKWLFSSEVRISENGLWRLRHMRYLSRFCWKNPNTLVVAWVPFLIVQAAKNLCQAECRTGFLVIFKSRKVDCKPHHTSVTSRGHFLKFWLQKKKVIFEGHPVDEALQTLILA